MPPKPSSRASKPASKVATPSKAAPSSRAAPASKATSAATSEKPASTRAGKPVSARPPASRRGAAASTPVNGDVKEVDTEQEQKELHAPGKTAAPAKKGRVAQLAADEPAAKRRRSSVGMTQINAIPQPPGKPLIQISQSKIGSSERADMDSGLEATSCFVRVRYRRYGSIWTGSGRAR